MKKLITLIAILLFTTQATEARMFENASVIQSSEYWDGWKTGYCEGWKDARNIFAPCPASPAPSPAPAGYNNWKGGYTLGFKKAIRDANE